MPAPVYETLISRRLLKLAFRAVQQACTEMLAVVLKRRFLRPFFAVG
jgi:hypothetical protein